MACQKEWKSYQEQLDLLKSRGMSITDDSKALEYLERIGYYRLSGYWYSFREYNQQYCISDPQSRKRTDNFKQGTCFHHAVDLYVFDKKLRLLLTDALERIEIALREDIAHLLGNYDPYSYSKPDTKWFDSERFLCVNPQKKSTKHEIWISKHEYLVSKSTEDSIQHYTNKHGLSLPIWVACEVWDFGMLSNLFSGMKNIDQQTISKKYDVQNGNVFSSWLHSLNYLRNICAHHSRLWNKTIVIHPKLPYKGQVVLLDSFSTKQVTKTYLLICITRHLVEKICPSSEWWERLKKLMLKEFPDIEHLGVRLSDMGTITDWYK